VLLHDSDDLAENWKESEIARDIASCPDVNIIFDKRGAEAKRFRIATSGHVVVYDPNGRLSYSGGITAARGLRGDNYGRATVIDRIRGNEAKESGCPVFGCALADPDLPGRTKEYRP
jgi:hypothetical protein